MRVATGTSVFSGLRVELPVGKEHVFSFRDQEIAQSNRFRTVELSGPARASGLEIESMHLDAAIGIWCTTSGDKRCVTLNQDGAANGPSRFDIAKRHNPAVHRCRPKPPYQLTVVGTQTIDISIVAAEEAQAVVKRGWAIDSTRGRERPTRMSRGDIQRV